MGCDALPLLGCCATVQRGSWVLVQWLDWTGFGNSKEQVLERAIAAINALAWPADPVVNSYNEQYWVFDRNPPTFLVRGTGFVVLPTNATFITSCYRITADFDGSIWTGRGKLQRARAFHAPTPTYGCFQVFPGATITGQLPNVFVSIPDGEPLVCERRATVQEREQLDVVDGGRPWVDIGDGFLRTSSLRRLYFGAWVNDGTFPTCCPAPAP